MPHGTQESAPSRQRHGKLPAKQSLPTMLYRVTLTLARCPDYPDGSVARGYEMVAPLGPDGHLDAAFWRTTRESCRVRRFWSGARDRDGRLVHRAGGDGGATWLIDYEDWTNQDDEPGYHLGTHAFVPGEYVSIRDAEDGVYHTFMVSRVSPASAGFRT
ncbi:hypothetical protein [Methylobacterium goesingense]|uniref:Uncharacterized protein n=1 Tax=Methylobacterium goesingense TaxID=243690 RepID=A0ABV2LFB3_9HYPH|nr:hypothetical protein CFIICLFH_4618 [Methylobacterium goesingense]